MDWKLFEVQKRTGVYERWTYFGKIIPDRFPVSFRKVNQIVHYGYNNLELGMDISVTNSQVIIDSYLIKGSIDVTSLMNVSRSYVKSIVDTIVYIYGIKLDVEIISGINVRTNENLFFNGPYLSLNRPNFDKTNLSEMDRVFKAITKDSALNYVLADFRQALFIPLHTGFYCYRAIERMMQSLKDKSALTSGSTKEDNAYWKDLQEKLKVSESTFKSIGEHAKNPRHGKPNIITNQQIEDIFSITDNIIKRYIEYLIRNFSSLPLSEFPILNDIVR